MKQKYAKITSALLLCLLACIPSAAKEKIHLVFIGNSITYGATLSSPSTQAPPVIVGHQIYKRTRNATLVSNCGVSGITTFGFLPGRNAYNNALTAGKKYAADNNGPVYFSIMLGTNDSAEKGTEGAPVSTATYKQNIKKIIDALHKEVPQAKFLLNYPIWYSPNTHNGATYLQAGLDRLNSYHPVIDNIVSEYAASNPGMVYAGEKSAYGFFENNTEYFTSEAGNSGTFYLHPNATGAVKLAEYWSGSIMKMLADDGIDEYKGSDEEWLKGEDLITDASQISTNTVESDQFGVENLIRPETDGYGTNQYIYHASWTQGLPAGQYPYLQFHLNEAQSDIYFMMISSEWNSTYDTPRNMTILATNTPDDESSWVEVENLQDIVTEIKHPVIYYSPHISLGAKYSDIRFVTTATVNNRKSNTGSLLVSLGRFQVIKAEKADKPILKLQQLLDDLSEKDLKYQGGNEPGYYSEKAVENYTAAFEAANYTLSQTASDEEYTKAEQDLRNAYNAVEASRIPVSDGYYYIASALPGFQTKQNVQKAMYATKKGELGWATLDKTDPKFLFKISMLPDSTFGIQNAYSGKYINTVSKPFSDEVAAEQTITQIETTPQFNIANRSNATPYHCLNHDNGNGIYGLLTAYDGKEDSPSAWYLLSQKDNETIAKLETDGKKAYIADQAALALSKTRYTREKANEYDAQITQGSQITSNSVQGSQFSPANLIRPESDGYGTNQYIFHSSWGNPLPADEFPYLQIKLNSALSKIRFKMISSEWNLTHDTPDQMEILATNTPDDESSWKNIIELSDMNPVFSHPVKYISPEINLGGEYTDLRLVVKKTLSNRRTSTGSLYLSLGRLQVFEPTPKANSEYFEVEGMKSACDRYDNIAKALQENPGAATLSDVQSLYDAAKEIDKLYVDRDSLDLVFAELMPKAQNAYDAAVPSLQALITNGSQITSNSVQGDQFTPANLIRPESDGYGTNQYIYHSSWSNPLAPDVMPYLQVHLNAPQSAFLFKMTSSEWNLTYDTPDDISILATNTPEDGNSWTSIKQLTGIIPEEQKGNHPIRYTSPMLNLGDEYTDVRFVVNSTINNRSNGNGGFFLSLGRFQMYSGVDPETVQYNYNPEVKTAADELKVLIDAGKQKGPHEVLPKDIDDLQAAIDKLLDAYADTTSLVKLYKKMMTRAENLTVGEETGAADSQESISAFTDALVAARNSVSDRQPTKQAINSAAEAINKAYDDMLEHINKIEPNKWYYIYSKSENAYCSGKAMLLKSADCGADINFGQSGSGNEDPAYLDNPYAMWRFVPVEGTKYYSIQNLATSHSVGSTKGKGNENRVHIQSLPSSYRIDYIGQSALQFVSTDAGNSEEYPLHAQERDSVIVPWKSEIGGASCWNVTPVEDDAYLKFPVEANSVNIITLPFDIPAGATSIMSMNDNIRTYSIKDITTDKEAWQTTVELTVDDDIKAGVPFVLIEGDMQKYDASAEPGCFYTTLPADVDTTARTGNGLAGTLNGENLTTAGYGYFANGSLQVTGNAVTHIGGGKGWIDFGTLVPQQGETDLVIRAGGMINSIRGLKAAISGKTTVNVYTVDGTLVKKNVKTDNARNGLEKGVYIIGSKKILVK